MAAGGNKLLYGDNLGIMREMPAESVDLIYLDPPFNSQRNYNVIYKNATGVSVPEQEEAFCDTWEMDAEKEELIRQMPRLLKKHEASSELVGFWNAWNTALRSNRPQLLAYLVYMTVRLLEMRRLLKPTGSIYLHCDPHASHYLKVTMDGIFGHENFRNEIIWHYDGPQRPSQRNFGSKHDVILRYSATERYFANPENLRPFVEISGAELAGYKKLEDGRYYYTTPPGDYTAKSINQLEESGRIERTKKGKVRVRHFLPRGGSGIFGRKKHLHDVWSDIISLGHAGGKEKLGYPTQKPIKLLERIIKASSNEGELVFDPFCGCGTTIYAAHENRRRWIGCDITILAVRLARKILSQRHGLKEGEDYQISGIPNSVDSAMDLWRRDRYQFQHWAVEKAHGFPGKRGPGDHGIDGRIWFETDEGMRSMVISVKGGDSGSPENIRELRGVVEREIYAEMGGFICFKTPTPAMRREAAEAGIYQYKGEKYPCIQILTVAELVADKTFKTPSKIRILEKERGSLI